VTNGPSEAVNKIIKRVRRLCIGIDFETLRAKLILGDFFVTRRPPHPLDTTPITKRAEAADVKAQKVKRKKKELGPNANTVRLRSAREAKDKTKGLIESPMDNQDYVKRVEHLEGHGVTLGEGAEENSPRPGQARGAKSSVRESVFKAKRPISTTNGDSKQLEMF
jgi:hypothetical protein